MRDVMVGGLLDNTKQATPTAKGEVRYGLEDRRGRRTRLRVNKRSISFKCMSSESSQRGILTTFEREIILAMVYA